MLDNQLGAALAKQLDDLLPKLEAQLPNAYRFRVTLDNLLKYCRDLVELETSLKEIGRKVVREFELIVYCAPHLGADSRYFEFVTVRCGSSYARYSISNAPNVRDANALEGAIAGFRDRHSASLLFRWWVGYSLCSALLLMFFIEALLLAVCWSGLGCPSFLPSNFWEGYRPLHFVFWASSICIIAYVIWSYFTDDAPSLSFRHAILYVDKEPKNNVFWVLLGSIMIAILSAVIVSSIR
jgi:hypothetical protein